MFVYPERENIRKGGQTLDASLYFCIFLVPCNYNSPLRFWIFLLLFWGGGWYPYEHLDIYIFNIFQSIAVFNIPHTQIVPSLAHGNPLKLDRSKGFNHSLEYLLCANHRVTHWMWGDI